MAWLSDDSLISIRSVLNLANGYGPVFNVGERVQAYTHTAWFFALAGTQIIISDIFTATFALSFLCATGAVALLLWHTRSRFSVMAMCFSQLILSKAFMDYTSSGLEVPLTYLLLLGCFYTFRRLRIGISGRAIIAPFLLLGLLYLNRPDMVLFFVPIAAMLFWKSDSKVKFSFYGIISVLPVIFWTIFSVFYYGIPVPNTALAKLGTGIPVGERMMQGLYYFHDSLTTDPLTLFCVFLALRFNLLGSQKRTIALGIALNLAYVCYVGGDFMTGRFFAPAFLLSVALLSVTTIPKGSHLAAVAGVLIFGIWNAQSTVFSGSNYTIAGISQKGIADERGIYYQNWGLMSDNGSSPEVPDWILTGKSNFGGIACGFLGNRGILSGPDTSWIDSCALTDPVLSRLPAKQRGSVRIGHFIRKVPENYEYAHQGDLHRLKDPEIRELVRLVHSVVRDDLWSWERIRDIYRLNNFKLSPNTYEKFQTDRFPERDIEVSDLAEYGRRSVEIETSLGWRENQPNLYQTDAIKLPERGLKFQLSTPRLISHIKAGLSAELPYFFFVKSNDLWTRFQTFPTGTTGVEERGVSMPEPTEISELIIICAEIEDTQPISHVVLE